MANTELNIELSPELLLQQSQEMLSLKSEYEALFQNTISDLQGVNAGWSEFLSNNFSAKIQTAQKSFAGVETMLQNGAYAARLAANGLGSVDSSLSRFISGNTVTTSFTTGNSKLDLALKTTKNVIDRITFNDELGDKERALATKATLELGEDILSVPINISKFTGNVAKGDYVSAAANVWGFINGVTNASQDAFSLLAMGIGRGISLVTGNDSAREVSLEHAEKACSNDGLADYLKSANAPDWAIKTSEVLDASSDVVGLYDAATGFVGSVSEAEKVLGSDMLSNETKMAYVKDVVMGQLGVKHTDYSDTSQVGIIRNEGGFYGNVKNICDWVTGTIQGEGLETLKDKMDLTSFYGDAQETVEKISEALAGVQTSVSPWTVA